MKIALVTGEYWPYIYGGAGVSTTLLVRQLRKEGISVDVYVFCKKHSSVFSNKGSTKYYDVIDDKFYPLVSLQMITTLWKRLVEYDLVHVYYPIQMAPLGFLRKTMLKTPVVATLNGLDAACLFYQRWMKFKCIKCGISDIMRCALKRSKEIERMFVPTPVLSTYFIIQRLLSSRLDRYFALSNVIKKLYVSAGYPEDKITVIPNMYDPTFLRKLEQVKAEYRNDKIVILYVGRLTRQKGVDDLIKAFSKVESQKAELWIVGYGPEERRLREIANKVNKGKKIRFLGSIRYSDLPTIYKKADIFVHPGRWPEPFGRTILEAMLAKIPIIASDSGAPPIILGDSGVIFKTGNILELAQSLEMLIEDKRKRMDLAAKAYDMAVKHYSPDAITKRILKEYKLLTHSYK